MSIQGTINQGLSLTGLLITQTPSYKNAAEAHKLDVQAKKIEKQAEMVANPKYHSFGLDKNAEVGELNKKAIELNKEAFSRAPTQKRFDTYATNVAFSARGKQFSQMRELADANAKAAQAARLETRKRILTGTPSEYLLKEDK